MHNMLYHEQGGHGCVMLFDHNYSVTFLKNIPRKVAAEDESLFYQVANRLWW